jgi:lipopolysaccharide/colanic/teichoic acid biosynthesis glycosyltransferase
LPLIEHGLERHVDVTPQRVKRLFDITFATLLLTLMAPAMVIIAIAIRLDSPGPVLFVQRRVGLRGRHFPMLKFRSMCADAEQRLPALSHLNVGGDRLIRIRADPRVTRLGSFLRRASLDELPQLLNVLRGDMSLVGPRPQSPSEVALYSSREIRRLNVPAGMTGLWQITERDNPGFDEWIRLDLEYIERWSLPLDLKIMLRTPGVLLSTVRRSTGDMV